MALIVEDGTGKADAESYVSVADAETYFTARGLDWIGSPATADKEQALRIATEWLDSTYAQQYRGRAKTEDQALDWPRRDAYDDDGRLFSSTALPVELIRATAEVALRYQADGTVLDADVAAAADVVEEEEQLGPLKTRTRYAGTKATQKRFPKVAKLMAAITIGGGRIVLG